MALQHGRDGCIWTRFLNSHATPSPRPSPPATVLVGKLKFIIFDQVIHQDDKFAHAGGHGDERFFAGGQQTGIKCLRMRSWRTALRVAM
jgi:hypothetical protein